jgi:hypothetical protein
MKISRQCVMFFVLWALATSVASGQSTVSPSQKNSWSENCGWMNWRDAGSPAASEGVRVGDSFLGGLVWCENIGWLKLGDGSPANGSDYENTNSSDYGVNFGPDLGLGVSLEGLAWGENVGWIKFGPFASLHLVQRARLDFSAGRLRGYAWGENIGWLNLDHAEHFVGTQCRADFNEDGAVDFFDYLDFVDAFSAGAHAADFNADSTIDFFDYLDFVDAFSAGC